mgnify:CR=1 FL=1
MEENQPTQEACDIPQTPVEPEQISPVNVNRIDTIKIVQVDYGYTVEVGCQKLVFETQEKLLQKLTAYFNNPAQVRNRWINNHEL